MIRDTTTIDINLPIFPHRKIKTGIYRSQCLESQRKGHENIRRENNGQQGCTSWTSGIKKTLLTNIQMFGDSNVMLNKAVFIDQKYNKNCNIVKFYFKYKITVFYLRIFKNAIYLCDWKAEFSAVIPPDFTVK